MIEIQGKSVLITAGNTASPIDKVRVISNIFRGRTGEMIAAVVAQGGWKVTLVSSMSPNESAAAKPHPLIKRVRYRTYDELAAHMEREIVNGKFDAIIHSAAVSDYKVAGVYRRTKSGRLVEIKGKGPEAAKIPSSYRELFLQLVPTEKLIDKIRAPWGFRGQLVKFKLQADMSDEELLGIAHRSLAHSKADLIVANCLEWSAERAYIVGADGSVENVTRTDLPVGLLKRLS